CAWPHFDRTTGARPREVRFTGTSYSGFDSCLLSLPERPISKPVADLMDRITVNTEQCGGRPCIRGMRIRVIDVLDLFAAGLSADQILEEMPDLEMDDLKAALQYAARKLDHLVIAAGRFGLTLNPLR